MNILILIILYNPFKILKIIYYNLIEIDTDNNAKNLKKVIIWYIFQI